MKLDDIKIAVAMEQEISEADRTKLEKHLQSRKRQAENRYADYYTFHINVPTKKNLPNGFHQADIGTTKEALEIFKKVIDQKAEAFNIPQSWAMILSTVENYTGTKLEVEDEIRDQKEQIKAQAEADVEARLTESYAKQMLGSLTEAGMKEWKKENVKFNFFHFMEFLGRRGLGSNLTKAQTEKR